MTSRPFLLWQYIRDPTQSSYLAFSPTKLTLLHVSLLIFLLLLRSLRQTLGYADSILSKCPTTSDSGRGVDPPRLNELHLAMPLAVREKDFKNYLRAVSRRHKASEIDGPQLSLFLSALTEPTMLLLLAHPLCPIRALGSVNVRNSFALLRPDLISVESLLRAGEYSRFLVTARLRSETRWAKRGVECDFEISLDWHDGKGGDSRVPVFKQVFTVLQFVAHGQDATPRQSTLVGRGGEKVVSTASAAVHMESSSPRKWAKVCKDYNPIHLSGFMARVFGMPGKLAHGNLLLARAVDVLQSASSHSILAHLRAGPCAIHAEFQRPVVVPLKMEMTARKDTDGVVRIRMFHGHQVMGEARVERL